MHDHTKEAYAQTGFVQRTRAPRRVWRLLMPFLRRWTARATGPQHTRYVCVDCNQWSRERDGYSYYQTRDYQELCWQCWLLRRAHFVNGRGMDAQDQAAEAAQEEGKA